MKSLKDKAADQTTMLIKTPDEQESVYIIDDEKFGLMSNYESNGMIAERDGFEFGENEEAPRFY